MIYHLKRNKEGMKMLNFEFRCTRSLFCLGILTIIFIALAFILPIEYSYENHFLENLEKE